MRKITIILCLLCSVFVLAQFNSNAPWMRELQQKKRSGKPTFSEVQQAFNNYWKTHDKLYNEPLFLNS